MTLCYRVVTLLTTLACACGDRSTTPSDALAGARSLVEEYVLRDSRGDRLSANQWFLESVLFDEPGWDRMTVIRGYTVGSARIQADTVIVPVSYMVIGTLGAPSTGYPAFKSAASVEEREFRVLISTQPFRIAAPSINQHVLVDSVLTRYLKLDKLVL